MNVSPRRGRRKIKLRKDQDFVYEERSVDFLLEREDRVEANGSERTLSNNISGSADASVRSKLVDNCGKNNTVAVSTIWSDNLVFTSISHQPYSKSEGTSCSLSLSRSQSPVRSTDSGATAGFVNNICGSDIGYRHNSSTRQDFLDGEECFLSASTTVRTDTSDMEKDYCGECEACLESLPCTAQGEKVSENVDNPMPSNQEVMQALWAAVNNVDSLRLKVSSLERHIINQDQKIDKFIESSKEDSSMDTSKAKVNPGKAKKDRVEEEKARQLILLQERLGSKEHESSISETVESSEAEVVDLKALKKKMTKKQRDLCGRKVADRMHQAGALFPQDDFESATSSGTESDSTTRKCRHKHGKQIKSGAKIKKRPVVQTELWPHTIANEDDGEEVTSENISLAKFFSCFSFIMLSCSKAESKGRTALLHAVSIVLEYLQWSEARAFHNVMLTKIEQRRIDWTADFSGLAENYIDKKVRLSMKAKRYPAGASSSYKANYSTRNIGKGYGANFRSNAASGNNRSLHGVICWQWNSSTCTYGDNCKRWHVCRTCADAGKLGEPHKASTHAGSGSRSRPVERA